MHVARLNPLSAGAKETLSFPGLSVSEIYVIWIYNAAVLTGRIMSTSLPTYLRFCPSLIRPSVCFVRAPNLAIKRYRDNKIGVNDSWGRSNWFASFQLKIESCRPHIDRVHWTDIFVLLRLFNYCIM